jgi:virginiamycin B lyase
MNLSFGMSAGLGAILLTFFAHTQPACADMPSSKFTSYPVPYAAPYGIVYDDAGPLKGIWFTNATLDAKSGAVEFSSKGAKTILHATPTAAAQPASINFVPGSDSLWFPETNTNKIARIDASRKITEYAIPTSGSKPLDIQHGSEGAMWFAESGVGKIGRIDSTGKITEYKVGAANDEPTALIAQSGALWFTEVGSGRIGRLTTSGDVSHFSTGKGKLTGDMTNGSDGSLWAPKSKSVVRLKTDGTLTEFPLPAGVVKTGAIFGKKDGIFLGAIKSDGQGAILSVSSTGQVNEYDLPRKNLLPIEMAIDPDGGFFMTVRSYPDDHSVSAIWRLQLVSSK